MKARLQVVHKLVTEKKAEGMGVEPIDPKRDHGLANRSLAV